MFQYDGKSLFSGVSEPLKLAFFVVFSALAFFFQQPFPLACLLLLLFALLAVAGYRGFLGLFLGLVPFLLLADIGFLFFLSGTGLDLARLTLVSNLRVFCLFLSAAFFTFSTDVFSIVRALKKLRLPESVYLPVYVLFRFLPEVERDLVEIIGIQKARGFTSKRPLPFLRALLVPLLVTVFQKSDELAVAYYLRKKRETS